jgi:hypothetical protein
MAADPDYPTLEAAYREAMIGSRLPGLMVARGDWIMAQRPDLTLKPDSLYYVTQDTIVEVVPGEEI